VQFCVDLPLCPVDTFALLLYYICTNICFDLIYQLAYLEDALGFKTIVHRIQVALLVSLMIFLLPSVYNSALV